MGSLRPDTRYARSGDVRIAYQVTGEGPVEIVYAPGTVSHLDMDWEWPARAELFQRLGSFCRLIRFDKRGTGMSDRPTYAASSTRLMTEMLVDSAVKLTERTSTSGCERKCST